MKIHMYRISWWKHKSFWPSKINKSFNRFAKDDKAEEPVLENANELIAELNLPLVCPFDGQGISWIANDMKEAARVHAIPCFDSIPVFSLKH